MHYTAQPICSPSRAAIMTGKCPARLNLTNFLPGRATRGRTRVLQPRIEGQLPQEEITLAEMLKSAGYATGLFGKWHLGGSGFGPQEQGFDVAVRRPRIPSRRSSRAAKESLRLRRLPRSSSRITAISLFSVTCPTTIPIYRSPPRRS